MQGNVVTRHDGTHGYGELLTALIAGVQALAMGLAVKFGYLVLVGIAAMRAVRAIGPAYGYQDARGPYPRRGKWGL